MLSFLLETSFWLLGKTLTTSYYMIAGSPKDPLLLKLEEMENKLDKRCVLDQSGNTVYYWSNKTSYRDGSWVVIRDGQLLIETKIKADALATISESSKENIESKCLLVHVGNECEMYEI